MDKTRQKQLVLWLEAQRVHANGWLKLSVLLGTFSTLTIITQAYCLASLLQRALMDNAPRSSLTGFLAALLGCFAVRAILHYYREKVGFIAGKTIRRAVRQQVINRLDELGPAWVTARPVGSWSTLLHEQIEKMQDYYARYLPQIRLAGLTPLLILITLYPVNWIAATLLLLTAPLIPLFMAMVGMGAADANRRNFAALARLGGDFLDRLRGLDTLRLFQRRQAELTFLSVSTDNFRLRTMEVLRIAFLSSAVLEFFASVSIALVAIYLGMSYLRIYNFGSYETSITLFAGFITLMLAPEFFQPLRDLGSFYHAKAQATGAAEELETFITSTEPMPVRVQTVSAVAGQPLTLQAKDLTIHTADGQQLAGPLNFTLAPGERVALVGPSGAGKSSLVNTLLGFMPYSGSLTVNGIELRTLIRQEWLAIISWLGQNPRLFPASVEHNITSGNPLPAASLQAIIQQAGINEFIAQLPQGLATEISENSSDVSVGQAQRIALARALAKSAALLILDEPSASLDSHHERQVMQALTQASYQQTTLVVTHQLHLLTDWQSIWVMAEGKIVQSGHYSQLAAQPGLFQQMLHHRLGDID